MAKLAAHVLVVDDNPDVLTSARLFLKHRVKNVTTASHPSELNRLLSEHSIDVVLLDMNFQKGANDGKEGMYWLKHLREVRPATQIILMTAYAEVALAVEALKLGAVDFIIKPWKNEALLQSIREAIQGKGTRSETRSAKSDDTSSQEQTAMIGRSSAMQALTDTARKVAITDASVLILGENGTGKEVLARYIHAHSSRAEGPFVSVDLGTIPETLFESELFGHVRGAFTDAKEDKPGRFRQAHGGTLFLDEIGNSSWSMQAKLLTVLQGRKVIPVGGTTATPIDIRLICATNQPLHAQAEEKTFRQDLLYRINTVELQVPALRDRPNDIGLLAGHFLQEYGARYQKPGMELTEEAQEVLRHYPWPGNVRELQHALERAVILSDGPQLTERDFVMKTTHAPENAGFSDNLNLLEMEKWLIQRAIDKNQGNISQAARDLGITRTALYRRMEKHGL